MEGRQEPPNQPTPAVPPPPPPYTQVHPAMAAGPKKPFWHIPIGVISLALAGMGALNMPVSMLLRKFDPGQKAIYKLLPEWYSAFATFSMILGFALSLILLVGGIMLIKRRLQACTLLVSYAIASLAVTCMNYAVILIGHVGDRLTGTTKFGWNIGLFGVLPFILAWPIFLLIWLARAKIRTDMQAWK